MKDEISKNSSGRIYEKLIEFWTNDTTREEEKSNKILETKKIWLKNYEENYGKEPVKERSKTQKRKTNASNRQSSRSRSRSRSRTRKTYAEAVKTGTGRPRVGFYDQRDNNEFQNQNRRRGPQRRRNIRRQGIQTQHEVQPQQQPIQNQPKRRNIRDNRVGNRNFEEQPSHTDSFLGYGTMRKKRKKQGRNQKL